MKQYTHLRLEEREKLYCLRKDAMSFSEIGRILKRNGSSLSREYKRNCNENKKLGYLPDTADNLSRLRKARHGSKISRNAKLKAHIINKMRLNRWSPEMIAGRLKYDKAKFYVSHECIYQFIYSEEGMKLELYKELMCRRPKRNLKYGRKTRSNHGIPNRVSISQRPEIRPEEFGHFEADTTFFTGSRQINLLTMVERKTGFFIANLNESKDSQKIALKMMNNLIKFPKHKRLTLTMDNGKEFVRHELVSKVTGIPTYFCRPGSPWEKPYVETTHALLHRFIAKKSNPNNLTNQKVQHAVNMINHLPRKRFNFRTPSEMIAIEKIYNLRALRP